MLGALGSRERQVIQMFAYVGPAMAAMAWIVTAATDNALLLFGGPCILAIILAHGRQHIIRMAYNFRSCMLQAGKIEREAGWKRFVLKKWVGRSEKPPKELLPEMFKSQVNILRLAMWSVIAIGAFAMLEPWLVRGHHLHGYIPLARVTVLVFLGACMEVLCFATSKALKKKLDEMYEAEKHKKEDHVPSNVPGDICHDPDVPSNAPGDTDDVAESG